MNIFTRMLVTATLLLGPASSLRAQTAVDPSGHWEGAIEAGGMAVPVVIDLTKNSKGELAGTFGQPSEQLTGLPLANISVDGRSVSFQIKGGGAGERAFKGTLAADGTSMTGDFSSHKVGTVPFALTRTGDPKIEATPRSPAIARELEGTWNGTLDLNGIPLRLILTMANQPDGSAIGSFLSVDEGLEIPITTITQKASSVTIDVKAVHGSYTGALNPAGTELVGTLTQGAGSMPVTFRRAQ
jgi:hypothetical protein